MSSSRYEFYIKSIQSGQTAKLSAFGIGGDGKGRGGEDRTLRRRIVAKSLATQLGTLHFTNVLFYLAWVMFSSVVCLCYDDAQHKEAIFVFRSYAKISPVAMKSVVMSVGYFEVVLVIARQVIQADIQWKKNAKGSKIRDS